MMAKHKQIISGPSYLAQGFRLLLHPALRWYVLIPLAINLVIFVWLTYYCVSQFTLALGWVMGFIPAWLDFLTWILWLFFVVLLAIVYGYSFTLLATFIASPFYGLLAEQAEVLLSGTKREEPLTFQSTMIIAKRSVLRELLKMGYFLPRILGVFLLGIILSFIPVLNLLAPIIALLWASWSLSLQYTDYAADNNQISFTLLKRQSGQRKMACFSFGGTVLFATSIPLLNLLSIPASVVAGTSLWLDHFQEKSEMSAK